MELRRSARDALVTHARAEAPVECCGLLLGTAGRIEEAVATRNLLASPSRYRIDPAGHFAAIRRARGEGRAIVGAYHSHPAGRAVPSATDLAEAHDERLLYVIVSLADPARPDVRAYRIAAGSYAEVALVTVP